MVSLLRHRLRHNRTLQRLLVQVAVLLLVSAAMAWVAWFTSLDGDSPEETAARLSERGLYAEADAIYRELVGGPDAGTRVMIAFVDNRAAALAGTGYLPGSHASAIEVLQNPDLSEETRTLGTFWYGSRVLLVDPDPAPVEALTSADPPHQYASRLLGRAAFLKGDLAGAATHFEREGMNFPREPTDLRNAFAIRFELEDWNWIRARVNDPRWAPAVGMTERVRLAIHDRDWPTVLLLIWPSGFEGTRLWPALLALVAATLWFTIGARMGLARQWVPGRTRLYVLAFILGILSIYPTLVLILIEDEILGFTRTGSPVPDAIFFIFGVGLREELCKFLAFLVLMPLLRKRRSRVEALICGAMVGLGFAAEENLGYFHDFSLSIAIARFLTANFLHMALTGLVAVAYWDGARARNPLERIDVVFPLAVVLHGAYDFFLSTDVLGPSSPLFAIIVFIVVAHRFLRELTTVVAQEDRAAVLRVFVLCLTILAGISYVYAASWVGPLTAIGLIAEGLLGVAVLIIMFFYELAPD